jgi:hypothetical protein
LSPLVPGFNGSAEFSVDGRDSVNPADKETVFFPESSEYPDKACQHGVGFCLLHDLPHQPHASVRSKLIKKRFEKASPRSEQVIDGLPGDAAFTSQSIKGQVGKAVGLKALPCSG